MSAADWVVLALVALGAGLAILNVRKNGACPGACKTCAMHDACTRRDKKEG